jgi:hypothetical protein
MGFKANSHCKKSVPPMSALGHELPRRLTATMSALPPKADTGDVGVTSVIIPKAGVSFQLRCGSVYPRCVILHRYIPKWRGYE